jgi:molybdopterin-guanine dinucleotide biosynthesis protein A
MEAERCAVIILAGGKSTRLGRDKASEVLTGKTLLQRAVDATAELAGTFVLVTARGQSLPEVVAEAPLSTVVDAYPETGPLGGIVTGLLAVGDSPQPALVVACDMPLLRPALLRELLRLASGHDAVVPMVNGLPEPLCAVYAHSCINPARRLLDRGDYKVAGLLDDVDALLVPEEEWRRFDNEGLSFLNVNREDDLDRARRLVVDQAPTDARYTIDGHEA